MGSHRNAPTPVLRGRSFAKLARLQRQPDAAWSSVHRANARALAGRFFRAPAECGRARTLVGSIRTLWSSVGSDTACATGFPTPLRRHREKRTYTVCRRANSSGKSRLSISAVISSNCRSKIPRPVCSVIRRRWESNRRLSWPSGTPTRCIARCRIQRGLARAQMLAKQVGMFAKTLRRPRGLYDAGLR